ncbi:elongation factor 1-alpha [Methylocaldum szegediense]|uniref:Elongation factor-1 alpha n=1 Tax=Methylocaldum szegediense TaxID=73780 RepID=A0ABM9I6E3_9GAMM|nr:elongation factor 1-alpha [Methylocaldum szegediense]CAI8921364.1 Elongation factor-1 alpha [Methylocaldum szegediense]
MPLNLSSLGLPIKLLFSGYLTVIAIGYAVAMVQILFTHGMADGKFGLSIEDIVYSYYGNRSGSVLESQLNGSMKPMAPDEERFKIIQWVRDGASEKSYEKDIKPIFEQRCISCHNAEASGIPDFTQFENIKARTASDEGATFQSLTRVSHIHLFGISFIFMFVGLIFGLSTGVPVKLKSAAIIMPYAFLLLDITSWWLTKLNPNFALLVVLGGAGLAMAFVFMWVVSMYEMWILPKKLPFPDRRNALTRS